MLAIALFSTGQVYHRTRFLILVYSRSEMGLEKGTIMQRKQIDDERKVFSLREPAPFRRLCLHWGKFAIRHFNPRLQRKECVR
jgi:hypothetical protein